MKKTDSIKRFYDYLESTVRWKDTLRDVKIPVLNHGEVHLKNITVSPWSLSQLALSAGMEMDDLLDFINNTGDLKIVNRTIDGRSVEALEIEKRLNSGTQIIALSEMISHTDIHGMIRMLVWISAGRSIEKTEDIPTLSDSILTVKNDLMIPDDFMPDYMMRLVESGVEAITDRMLSDILDRDYLFHLVCGFDSDRNAYPVSIIPSTSFSSERDLELYTLIQSKLKDVFAELSSGKDFENLTIGRTIRALIYQLEKNKKRELSGFLWKGEKIDILKSLDLVEEIEGKSYLKQGIDSSELGLLYSRYRTKIERLSNNWLNTKISL